VAFDAGPALGIVGDVGGAFQHGFLFEVEMDVGFEEERASEKSARGDNKDAAMLRSEAIDGGLKFLGVQRLAVGNGARVGRGEMVSGMSELREHPCGGKEEESCCTCAEQLYKRPPV